ncbi:cysteine--tRNA ligase, partial [Candidatus Woesearchaeota archaeon]|nr:cysteine--tRNA ligase [Candidatus Woesearchaeota archaeon]
KDSKLLKKVSLHYQQFIKEMEKDFNTPAAAAQLFELAKELNLYLNNSPEKKTLTESLSSFQVLVEILGLQFTQAEEIPSKIRELAKQRETARKNKDWTQSDILRKKIETAGYLIDDTAEGTRIRKKK